MGKAKTFGMGLGLVVVIIFGIIFAQGMIAGTDSNSNEEKLNHGSQGIGDLPDTIKSTPKTYMKSVESLLPTQADIETEWEFEEKTPLTDHSTDASSIGLLDKAQQQYNYPKVPGELPYNVIVTIYQFDSSVNSRNYIIERAGFDHGYKTPESWGGKLPETNCYAMVGNFSEEKYDKSLVISVGSEPEYNRTCLEQNIVYDIKVENRDYKNTVKEFTDIINEKINLN